MYMHTYIYDTCAHTYIYRFMHVYLHTGPPISKNFTRNFLMEVKSLKGRIDICNKNSI